MQATTSTVACRILLVDDVPDICTVLEQLIARYPSARCTAVSETESGRALERVRQERFDVVVSDFRMRDHDGFDVLTAARASNPEGKRILMTGYNEIPADPERLEAAGVDGHLHKPFGSRDIFHMLDVLLGQDVAARERLRTETKAILEAALLPEADGDGANAGLHGGGRLT